MRPIGNETGPRERLDPSLESTRSGMSKARTPRTQVLDPDHPAFLVMDEGHCQWLHQLDTIWPGFLSQKATPFAEHSFVESGIVSARHVRGLASLR